MRTDRNRMRTNRGDSYLTRSQTQKGQFLDEFRTELGNSGPERAVGRGAHGGRKAACSGPAEGAGGRYWTAWRAPSRGRVRWCGLLGFWLGFQGA
jgi:hypothetical protein